MKKLFSLVCVIVLFAICIFAFGGCGTDPKKIVVGASSAPHAQILEQARAYLEEKGFTLEIVEYSDYVQPNIALNDGSLDANYFQHQPYLDGFNVDHKMNLVSVLKVHFEPLGIYKGSKGTTISELSKGDKIALPDDATNCARALQLLDKYGIIRILNDKGLNTTVKDVDSKGLELIPLEAGAIAVQLPELSLAVINGNYAVDFNLTNDLVGQEDKNSQAYSQYANILVVKNGREKNAKTLALIEALTQDNIAEFIEKTYGGIVVPYVEK